jgi:hypothetical protein
MSCGDGWDGSSNGPVQPLVYTAADLPALKAAITSGVLSVTYAGPPARTITYQSLEAMRALYAQMVRDVNNAPTYRLAGYRSGFDRG